MKKVLIAIALTVLSINNAYAEEQGAWVAVDATGKVVSGAIVCTASVCGDVNSSYSKDTLQEGQKYVLQTKAESNGNVFGIGNNNPNKEVTVDLTTNTFTVTEKQTISITPSVVVVQENVQTFNPYVPNNGLGESLNTNVTTTTVKVETKNTVDEANPYLKLDEFGDFVFDWELFLEDLLMNWQIDWDALWTYFAAFNL
jgi:asparagine N-glycosylation enzyme membrane subunit Stt3